MSNTPILTGFFLEKFKLGERNNYKNATSGEWRNVIYGPRDPAKKERSVTLSLPPAVTLWGVSAFVDKQKDETTHTVSLAFKEGDKILSDLRLLFDRLKEQAKELITFDKWLDPIKEEGRVTLAVRNSRRGTGLALECFDYSQNPAGVAINAADVEPGSLVSISSCSPSFYSTAMCTGITLTAFTLKVLARGVPTPVPALTEEEKALIEEHRVKEEEEEAAPDLPIAELQDAPSNATLFKKRKTEGE